MSVGGEHVDDGACHDCLRSACLRGVSMGFVGTGGVSIGLPSGKGEATLAWAVTLEVIVSW